MQLEDLLHEISKVEHRFWFVRRVGIEQTDDALRARLEIQAGLFVQVFLSEKTGRLSFALVEGNQRIYGCDLEGGFWHVHPYGMVEEHQAISQGKSPRPLLQFMCDVETILVENDLI